MKKATLPRNASHLEEIPNVGPRIAQDLHLLAIKKPSDLKSKDPYKLYIQLCELTKAYHDPCVLDTFMAAVYFMNGEGSKPWWHFTEIRKNNVAKFQLQVAKWK